jgi:hypothetical protein
MVKETFFTQLTGEIKEVSIKRITEYYGEKTYRDERGRMATVTCFIGPDEAK